MAKFCMHCGKPLLENAEFCSQCGAKIVSPPSDNNIQQKPVQQPVQQQPPSQQPIASQQPYYGQQQTYTPVPQKKNTKLIFGIIAIVVVIIVIIAVLFLVLGGAEDNGDNGGDGGNGGTVDSRFIGTWEVVQLIEDDDSTSVTWDWTFSFTTDGSVQEINDDIVDQSTWGVSNNQICGEVFYMSDTNCYDFQFTQNDNTLSLTTTYYDSWDGMTHTYTLVLTKTS